MRFNQSLWLLLLVSSFHASTALACSASPSVFTTSVDDVETYPANAAVLLEVQFYNVQDFEIEINGVPGELTHIPELSYQGEVLNYMVPEPSILAAQISPEPMEGDTLRLELVGCGYYCEWETTTWTWTAGPPDTHPPATLTSFEYDLYQYPPYTVGDYCVSETFQHSWFFDVRGVPSEGESIELYRLEVRYATNPDTLLYTDTWYLNSRFEKEQRWDTELSYLQDPATALCFTITQRDLASHAGNSLTTCQPEHCRIETQPLGVTEYSPPTEPSWTEEDLFAYGKCRTTYAGETVATGCGCSLPGTPAPPLDARWVILGLGLIRVGTARRRLPGKAAFRADGNWR